MTELPTLALADGTTLPVLGQGTWEMGEDPDRYAEESRALNIGLDHGLSLIDTAEMYGSGRAERLIGDAIGTRRDEFFLVDKVLPSNASREGTVEACHRSLDRLGTDHIDLYLLHWPGNHPLSETLEAFEQLIADGAILRWGVSNFDTTEIDELLPLGTPAVNQILYNLGRRGPEYDLLPRHAEHSIRTMAYSPIERGKLLANRSLNRIAARRDVPPARIALAWLLSKSSVLPIPKASSPEHTVENARAAELTLSSEEQHELDNAFPAPNRKVPLAIL